MAEEVRYYAIIRRGSVTDEPTGLIRRRFMGEGRVDESLREDLSWQYTSALYEWEMGDVSGRELTEISEEEAERLVERFRERWATPR